MPRGKRNTAEWRVPGIFNEVELAMSLNKTWGEWLDQPPEHRALYIVVSDYRAMMGAVEQAEREAVGR